jgi:acetyl esterase/lipase
LSKRQIFKQCFCVLPVWAMFGLVPRAFAADAQIIKDVPYVEKADNQHKLDLFFSSGPRHHLIPLIVLHGGCFMYGDKRHMRTAAMQFVDNLKGFVAIAPNYTLATPTTPSYPQVLDDLHNLMTWIHSPEAANYGIDATHIVAYGESAGATLAGYLGTRPLNGDESTQNHAAVEVVIDFYGRTDFTIPRAEKDGKDCPLTYLHATRAAHMDLFKDASVAPVAGVEPADFLIVHGLEDRQVPYFHSVRLAEALRQGPATVDLLLLPGVGHGLDQSLTTAWHYASGFLQNKFQQK